MKKMNLIVFPVLSVSLLAIVGCARDHSREMYYSNTAIPYSVVSSTGDEMPIAQRRVDITDSGPGTPRGDSTSADPSETSTQGAGSRALVGEPQNMASSGTLNAPAGGSVSTGENRLSTSAIESGATAGSESQSTAIPLYREEINIGKRQVDAGQVTIRKKVETETVNEPVELRHETVVVERRPASETADQQNSSAVSGTANMQPFQEQEITIPLKREEAVVEKQVVPAGEVVAETRVQTETKNVQSQVRREDVDVDRDTAPNTDVRASEDLSAVGASSESFDGQSSGAASGSRTITDLSTLASGTAASLVGSRVQLNNARVRVIVDPTLIGLEAQGREQPVYVHLQQPVSGLQEGDSLNVSGTIQSGSQASRTATRLSADASHVLGVQDFFIHAQNASKSQQ